MTRIVTASLLCLFVSLVLFCVSAPLDSSTTTACDKSTSGVPSTPMEAALHELQRRFPNQIVVAFEEFADEQRPACEPHIDLGPPGTTLAAAVERVRKADTRYRVELTNRRLVHVSPAHGTADSVGLLDLPLKNFAVPPDDCLHSAMTDGIARGNASSYTPELGEFLTKKQEEWDRNHGNPSKGTVGSILGDCYPNSRPGGPVYPLVTLRQALDIMALRSLQVTRGEVHSNGPGYITIKALSWQYRFRRNPLSANGLGGVPVFQVF